MRKKTLKKNKNDIITLFSKIDKSFKVNEKIIDLKRIKKIFNKSIKYLNQQNQETIVEIESKISKYNLDINKKNILINIFQTPEKNNILSKNPSKQIKTRQPNKAGEHKCFTDYKYIRELGRGAFGITSLTEKDGKEYAIKKIEIRFELWMGNIDDQIKKIKNEIKIAKMMGEENVGPKIHDYYLCKSSGNIDIYIIMDYMNLGTLLTWLQTNKLNEKQENEIMKKITKMHQKITHRDLHLANILVHKHKNKISFYISDFGLGNTFNSLIEQSKEGDFKRFKDSIELQNRYKYNDIISSLFIICGLI